MLLIPALKKLRQKDHKFNLAWKFIKTVSKQKIKPGLGILLTVKPLGTVPGTAGTEWVDFQRKRRELPRLAKGACNNC